MTVNLNLKPEASTQACTTNSCRMIKKETVTFELFPVKDPSEFSTFRKTYQTSEQMKSEFNKFLKTIFYQLDGKKTFELMEKLLSDPNKTDEQVYNELLQQIHTAKKRFPILRRIYSLLVLKILDSWLWAMARVKGSVAVMHRLH